MQSRQAAADRQTDRLTDRYRGRMVDRQESTGNKGSGASGAVSPTPPLTTCPQSNWWSMSPVNASQIRVVKSAELIP
jgi:hypothetical protein